MTGTKIILLGTGTPNIFADRMGPSFIVLYDEVTLLFDAGSGIVRRAKEAKIPLSQLDTLFISHLHTDHTLGLPDFMFAPSVSDRTNSVSIYGPKGTDSMISSLLKAYELDLHIRLFGLEKGSAEAYKYNISEISPGKIHEQNDVIVESFLVDHGDWPCFGFRIQTPDRIIIYSGDTRPCENLITKAKNCDILIHEVYSLKNFSLKSQKWQKYHQSMHTSTKELAFIANKVSPKQLVLFHQLYWQQSQEGLLNEVKLEYDGEVINGIDLLEL